jgi:hypothetical protein
MLTATFASSKKSAKDAPSYEKIMVFKSHTELPDAFTHYKGTDFLPKDREKVVVEGCELRGKEWYLQVRHHGGRHAVLSIRHFRTIVKDKLRQKLLAIPIKSDKVKAILTTL